MMRPQTRRQTRSSNDEHLVTPSASCAKTTKPCVLGPKALKMRRYRKNISCDPERLEKARRKDRKRKKEQRKQQRHEIQNGNRQLQNKIRKQTRNCMRKYRKNDRQSEFEEKLIKKTQAIDRTDRWRMRIKLQEQEHTTKDNNINVDMESTESQSNDVPKSIESSSPACSPSRWTIYRATRKVREHLPGTPIKKAAVIEKLIESPTTSKILKEKGLLIGKETKQKLDMAEGLIDNMKTNIQMLKSHGTQETEKKIPYNTLVQTALIRSIGKKYSVRTVTANLGLGKNKKKKDNWLKVSPRKHRKDRISEEVRDRVKQFYLSPEVSREVPNKKDVMKVKVGDDTEYIQKNIMSMTSSDAYHMYRERNTADKIGFTLFKKLKPSQVKRVSETNRRSCLCQICCNVALKVEALQKFATQCNVTGIETNKQKILELTLCAKGDSQYHNNKCLTRDCDKCGCSKIKQHYSVLEEKSKELDKDIEFHKWEAITVDREDSKKRIISCVSKQSSFSEFSAEFENDLGQYASHKFRAAWQQQQMVACQEKLTENNLMMVMDFSENYKCSFQNEVQSAYFDQNLVTIHPIMNYYKQNINEKPMLVKHSIIGISNDLKHDSSLVKVFENKTLDIIKERTPVTESVAQFTDGCASQYKGKIGFSYISERQGNISRNFFETSHGKNVCDGLGAIVKTSCYRAMLTGKVIGKPEDVFTHCCNVLARDLKVNEKESTASIRQFIFVDKSEIDRTNIPNVKTLIGTRKVHSIRNTGHNLVVEARNLSCFCDGCLTGTNSCMNQDYVEEWATSNLNPKAEGPAAKLRPQHVSTGEAPLVSKQAPKSARSDSIVMGDLHVNGYVAVSLSGAKTKESFVAQVVDIDTDSGEVKLSFMVEKGGLYLWPDEVDVSWEHSSSILEILPEPSLSPKSTNRRNFFVFT